MSLETSPLTIADRTFDSRLFLGTGKFASPESMRDALASSGTQVVTVALRRADLTGKNDPFANILEFIDPGRYLILPNTSGAMNADEAGRMFAASLAKLGLVAQVVPSPITLFADATIQRLITEGFLGQLLAVESRIRGGFIDSESPMHWRQNAELSGNNILAMGIYYEAIVRWAGRVTNVMARAKTFTVQRLNESGEPQSVGVPEHLDVALRHSSALPIKGRWCFSC